MLVHTALNKTIHTALDPYFCHAGTPIWQTFSRLSSYFTPPAANIAKLFMWVKQVPPSSRDSTNKSTISREGLTPNYCMFTLINNISLTYLSLALRPMPVGLWVREKQQRGGGLQALRYLPLWPERQRTSPLYNSSLHFPNHNLS